jgi:hypothetical protein
LVASTHNTRKVTKDFDRHIEPTKDEINSRDLTESLSRIASEQGRPANPVIPQPTARGVLSSRFRTAWKDKLLQVRTVAGFNRETLKVK